MYYFSIKNEVGVIAEVSHHVQTTYVAALWDSPVASHAVRYARMSTNGYGQNNSEPHASPGRE